MITIVTNKQTAILRKRTKIGYGTMQNYVIDTMYRNKNRNENCESKESDHKVRSICFRSI